MNGEKNPQDLSSPTDEDQGCLGKSQLLVRCISVLAARLFYFGHTFILIWRITEIFGKIYWYIACGFLLYMIDLCVILFKRKGREWNWFQPVVVIFLLIEIPCIWLLELDKVSIAELNYNETAILEDFYKGKGGAEDSKDGFLSKDTFTLVLEQSMLVVIIIARWLMPKGDLTRDQLSALLLVYLGTAADLVDFFSVLAEDEKLLLKAWFYFPILATWSWSMVQFIFVSTMVESNDDDDADDEATNEKEKQRETNSSDPVKKLKESNNTCGRKIYVFLQSEAWSIVVSVFMQDGPFVVIRLICLFHWNIHTYTNYFFTLKNALVLLLQLYRVVAVYQEHKRQKEETKKKMEKMKEKIKKQVAGSNGTFDNHPMPNSGRGRMRKVHPQPETTKQTQSAWDFGDDYFDGI